MTRFLVWPATRYELAGLIRDMRSSDREEITYNARVTGRIGPGWSIGGELEANFHKFQHWAILMGQSLVAVGGIAPLPQNNAIGAIWMLGTDLADTHWREMTRAVRGYIAANEHDWFAIGNVVPAHMEKRRRWMEHLGFDMAPNEAQAPEYGLVAFWSQASPGPEDGPAAP